MDCSISIKRKRLLYQSMHRGMKELDTIFSAFAACYLDLLDKQELEEYEIFLNVSEADLYTYLVLHQPFPDHLMHLNIAKRLQQFIQQQLQRES